MPKGKIQITKDQVQGIIDRNIGKGKVILTGDPVQREDKKWEVRYEENNRLEKLVCKDYDEAEKFCLAFGGNNVLTVAASMEFNDFENWSFDKIFSCGHHIKEIKLMQSICDTDKEDRFAHVLPTDCGSATLPGSNRKEANVIFHQVILNSGYVLPRKVCFDDPMQLDKFKDWVMGKFPAHKFMVDSFVSQNHETSDYCKFVKQKVGDSTKRMELKLVMLNGESYTRTTFKRILAAADGLAVHQCKVLSIELQEIKKETICGTFYNI